MPSKVKYLKTPSRIMADIIMGAMSMRGETRYTLAKKMHLHHNTVYLDLKDPERIPQDRLWLYFTVLEIPVGDYLQAAGKSYLDELTRRE